MRNYDMKMKTDYDILIEAQCSDSMSSIELEEVSQSLQETTSEDVNIRLCERIAFLIYQDSNFGLISVNPKRAATLENISRLCKSRIQSGFPVDGESFVGPSPNDCQSYTRERILTASLLSSPKKEISSLLCSFSAEYPSSASFSQRLLDNDERFLSTLLVLLSEINIIPCDSTFHPISVFLEALHLISHDCEVLIDWLNSELSACSLLLRVLKSNCNSQCMNAWKNYSPKKIDQKSTRKIWREERVPLKKPIVSLKITELVGDQEMTKQMDFCGLETRKVEYQEPMALQNEGSFSRWAAMVKELRVRLQRLLTANLIAKKFDVLLKWCDKFIETFPQ